MLPLVIFGCQNTNKDIAENVEVPTLAIDKAEFLYHFAFDCIDKEYPNKLGQTLGDSTYLATPSVLHPAFYGCFDWHSSLHGHWILVNLLRSYPNLDNYDSILSKLESNITSENIAVEMDYFNNEHNKNYERTYGWVWLFKLAEALDQWIHPRALTMSKNLQPLVDTLERKLIDFLPKLTYPIREGTHSNTAFALSFAIDYARSQSRPELEKIIIERAKEYYLMDINCPITWEPGGFDFFSPCLQEASLMTKVLSKDEFLTWINQFMPGLLTSPEKLMQPAIVTDRSDGQLAHLDGLNFSRAWCLYEIGTPLDNQSLIQLANDHFKASYEQMGTGEYAGEHWLASFALYALIKGNYVIND
ncbi:MAG: DUF2891 domain-containing protein [Bacteroidetes bacterium]|nr:DUF2891 domain-containing protein [Bacteroidota bacterium]